MNVKKYPTMKIFFVFLFCPFFAGLIIGPISLIVMLVGLFSDARLLGQVRGGEAFSVLLTAPLFAELVFFVPSLVFACCISFVKPVRSFKVCRNVSICGAVVASLWMFLSDCYLLRNSAGYSFMDSMLPASIAFFGGALITGLLSYWSLPKYSPD
ncbi:hypothetical protein GIV23_04115 [Pseudomonas sp. PA-1-2A]|uniref:hypothetical protein n=2 Tax=Pseudomonas TaxID=286 RepID=UPI0011B1E377|nr:MULTISPECIES: hypothetical protein [Pseudomonas]MBY8952002.1 hypothetical protein [Pseudomonas carnis]MCF5691040.1 hypothetical protein [Pseudomonas sp. PA-1-8C]MCF5786199.1 hypothetical protein [Pseudomonas sp. PA-1-6G]MCF5792807.1 hypothetical protein [Pseudomonas sp. PA-1-6B]MCF5812493.1 hypothetical protein [Pseudomonas sp. PA-1-2A]